MPHTFPTETHLRTWNPQGDAFGRQDLAKRVVENILTKMETPNVLGIYGDWGTGKTTFLHYLQMVITGKQKNEKEEDVDIGNKELDDFRASFKGDLDKIEVIHFEPWKYEYAKDADLLFALIKQIDTKLQINDDEILNAVFSMSQVLRAASTSVLVNSIKSVTQDVVDLDDISERLKILKKEQSELAFEEYKKWDTEFNGLEELFVKFIKRVLKDKEKLVIFIDDLDRCLPENTIRLLEAMKNFLYHHGVVFALAIDRRVVSEMIDKKYGLSKGYGSEYLEKIINLHIDLPGNSFKKVLEEMFLIHGFNLDDTQNSYLDALSKFFSENVKEPRRAKRIVRQFLMQRYLLESSLIDGWYENETNALYLFFAAYLRYKWPQYFNRNSVDLLKVLVTCEKMRDHAHAKSGGSIDDIVASRVDISSDVMREIYGLLFSQSLFGQQGTYSQRTLISALEVLRGDK